MEKKKYYISPKTSYSESSVELLLVGSVGSDEVDAGYGGVDEEGEHEASSRRSANWLWDEN